MYTGLTEEICEQAWNVVYDGIHAAANNVITNKLAGTIVVLHPVDGTKIFEQTIDSNGRHDDAKYRRLAHAKAHLTRRTGMASREVQQRAPHLLQYSDVKWGGSTVRDGLIVAFSGVQAAYDEMIAEWMTSAIIAMCRHEMTREGGVMDADYSFIGGD